MQGPEHETLSEQERALLCQGIQYFRQGDYFAAHDAWEEVWRGLHGRRRLFWQALIQLAVGAHHWQHGNLTGCCSVWHKALEKCNSLGETYASEVPAPLLLLIDVLYECLTAVARGDDPSPLLRHFATAVLSEAWLAFA